MITRYQNPATRRKARVRRRIYSTTNLPRLTIFRSNKHIHAQIIDDIKHRTLIAVSDLQLKANKSTKTTKTKTQQAQQIGKILAQKAKRKKITQVVFDRGAYKYHGRIKALAEAAKKEGLVF